jgi:hypothetical protein
MGPVHAPAREVEDAPETGLGVPAIDAQVANAEVPDAAAVKAPSASS